MKVASVEITTACDLACGYCQQAHTGEFMDETTFRQVLGTCREAGYRAVALGGGEPLLHPGVNDFLHLARQAGFTTALTTNATLPERVYRLKNLDYLGVSCGKGEWEAVLDWGREAPFAVTAVVLLTKGGLEALRNQAVKAYSLGCRRFMFTSYKGDQQEYYPSREELALMLAVGAYLGRTAGAVVGIDAYTYRRLGLLKECRGDFVRFDVYGRQQPCCFSACEYYLSVSRAVADYPGDRA
ncbi:radical SAM protein [Thermanaeromonas toyohensis]|uniref:radical SAM protein n=1 Tax=Thermanaeromonas toyohensis TaxID=161154 RepID=UPI000A03C2B2|nr:radical SAM protein [Thermanaeromonas toyohensis]